MASQETTTKEPVSTRRVFLAAAGAGILLGTQAAGQEVPCPPLPNTAAAPATVSTIHSADDLRIAFIGCGAQGLQLLYSILRLPNIRIVALCDIWEYSRKRFNGCIKKQNHDTARIYTAYEELLEKEKDLDAIVVATPDFVHAEHAIACMNAGHHVYCEAPMARDLHEARRMVNAAQTMKRLLQIGHQRRSNPRYTHAIDKLIHEKQLLGRINHAYCQWNRYRYDDLGWPKKYEMPGDLLKKHGYDTMGQFRNWRNYRAYSGGLAFLHGSHQFDVFNWAFGGPPRSVYATGGRNEATHRESYESLLCMMEYDMPEGICRTHSEYIDGCPQLGSFERIGGQEATLLISEIPACGNCVFLDNGGRNWDFAFKEKLVGTERPKEVYVTVTPSNNVSEDVRMLPITFNDPVHLPHLQNFFDAIRGRATLTCPPEIGYQAAAVAQLVNKSIRKRRPLQFQG